MAAAGVREVTFSPRVALCNGIITMQLYTPSPAPLYPSSLLKSPSQPVSLQTPPSRVLWWPVTATAPVVERLG